MKIIFFLILFLIKFLNCSSLNKQTKNFSKSSFPEVAIINAQNGDILATGFLIGTASGEKIKSVEVKIGNTSFIRANGTYAWSFKLPTTDDRWKKDQKIQITVRAINEKDEISKEAVVNVIKGRNRDLNGDGFPDLVMGDHLYDNTKGAAFVYYGNVQGAEVNISGKKATKVLLGKNEGSHLGKNIAVDDFNHDGFADLIITHRQGNKIQAYFYNGSIEGVNSPNVVNTLNDMNLKNYFGIMLNANE